MAIKDRNELKDRFKAGSRPSEGEFHDLIDSMLNIKQEGFNKTPEDGLKIAQLNHGALLSFYENIDLKSPIWSIRLDRSAQGLVFSRKGEEADRDVLSLCGMLPDRDGSAAQAEGNPRVGINTKDPQHELDVEGVVSSDGRVGRKGKKTALADGEWHDITEPLRGCHAFEVMAGVGLKGSGQYAILHAYALNAFNSKNHITYHQAHFDSRCNRLELRWQAVNKVSSKRDEEYTLQIRVGCAYQGTRINYYLTQLWFDSGMDDCKAEPEK
jgi:hypothetical protein